LNPQVERHATATVPAIIREYISEVSEQLG
jgi:hypothetical protein